MNYNEGILLHTLSLQQNDSRIDSSLCTYPAGLGHKIKLSIIEEITHINSLNDAECHSKEKKHYSKNKGKHIKVVFMCSNVSLDQIEKRSYTLNAGGNSVYGARHGYSSNYKDIANKLCSCESCKEKLSQGIDFDHCHFF